MPVGMLFTKRNENTAWSQVIKTYSWKLSIIVEMEYVFVLSLLFQRLLAWSSGLIGHLHDEVILLLRPESFRGLLSCANLGFCHWNLAGITKLKYERKNEKDSGHSSKMTPSCKWLIRYFSLFFSSKGASSNLVGDKFLFSSSSFLFFKTPFFIFNKFCFN